MKSALVQTISAAAAMAAIFTFVFNNPFAFRFIQWGQSFTRIPFDTWEGVLQKRSEMDQLFDAISQTSKIHNLQNTKDFLIPSPEGHDIHARLYYRKDYTENSELLPVMFYFHGGGFVLGSIEATDEICRQMVLNSNIAVISLEYRLSPEAPYPAALNDVTAAFNWLQEGNHRTIEALRILDPSRVYVGGDSAGGNLATAFGLKLLNTGEINVLKGMVLVYPCLLNEFEYPSYQKYGSGFVLTIADMKQFWKYYLEGNTTTTNTDLSNEMYISPLKTPSFSGFPPVLVISAAVDILVDESYEFVQRLREDNVQVSHHVYDTMHGFLSLCHLNQHALAALKEIQKFLS